MYSTNPVKKVHEQNVFYILVQHFNNLEALRKKLHVLLFNQINKNKNHYFECFYHSNQKSITAKCVYIYIQLQSAVLKITTKV